MLNFRNRHIANKLGTKKILAFFNRIGQFQTLSINLKLMIPTTTISIPWVKSTPFTTS